MRLLLPLFALLLPACPVSTGDDDGDPPTIDHTPPDSAPELADLVLSATITAEGGFTATIFHRLPAATEWSSAPMQDDDGDGLWSGTVPAAGVQFPTLEYYIEADGDGVSADPADAPASPHSVNVTDRPAPDPSPVRAHWNPDLGQVDLSWATPDPLDLLSWTASSSALDGADPAEVCAGSDPISACVLPGDWGAEYALWTVSTDDGDGGAPTVGTAITDNLHLWQASWGKVSTPQDPLPFGTGAGEFNLPNGVLVTADRVFVVEQSNHRVQLFDHQGIYLGRWGASQGNGVAGNGNGEFNSPSDITTDGQGHVLVSDFINGRVQVFQENGTFQRSFGTVGNGDGQLRFPASLAVDGDGMVHVAETTNHRVSIFSIDGTFQSNYTAVAGVAITSDRLRINWVESLGAIVIGHGEQLLVRPGDGSPEWAIDLLDSNSLSSVQGVCETRWGELLVAVDGGQQAGLGGDGHRFLKLDSTGGEIGGFGDFGDDPGFFLGPVDCAPTEDGSIAVVDSRNHRLQFFGP